MLLIKIATSSTPPRSPLLSDNRGTSRIWRCQASVGNGRVGNGVSGKDGIERRTDRERPTTAAGRGVSSLLGIAMLVALASVVLVGLVALTVPGPAGAKGKHHRHK